MMSDDEAIEICERWFKHLDGQRGKTETLLRAASLARQGKQAEADEILRQTDRKPVVFDGATLRPAVEHLLTRLHHFHLVAKGLKEDDQ